MSNQRFNDELLSAIIDDEADTELVASVQESPEASARLEHMRQAVQVVAEAPAEASPERRSASIAAAMAAASPAPEVTSLAAARHVRTEAEKKKRSLSGGWVLAVAAAVAFLIAIPIAIGFGGNDVFDTASDAAETADDSAGLSIEAADAAGDAADVVEDAVDDDSESAADAMENDGATEDEEAMEEDDDEAMEDSEPEAESAPTTTASNNARAATRDELINRRGLASGNNLDVLNNLIDFGTIAPLYSADDVLLAQVSPECLQADAVSDSPTPYGLALLTPFDRLILVEFAEDGTTRLLNAEDCAVLR